MTDEHPDNTLVEKSRDDGDPPGQADELVEESNLEHAEEADVEHDEETSVEEDSLATEQENASIDDGQQDEEAKPSPAEAFSSLRQSVDLLAGDVADIGNFIRVCRDKLLYEADEFRREGMDTVLQIIYRVHDQLFRQVQAMESGQLKLDGFAVNLLENFEAELQAQGITVIRPQPGDAIELTVMKTIGNEPRSFWRKSQTVARIEACGFACAFDSDTQVLRKADVTAYR